jgi:hypothetical protein
LLAGLQQRRAIRLNSAQAETLIESLLLYWATLESKAPRVRVPESGRDLIFDEFSMGYHGSIRISNPGLKIDIQDPDLDPAKPLLVLSVSHSLTDFMPDGL